VLHTYPALEPGDRAGAGVHRLLDPELTVLSAGQLSIVLQQVAVVGTLAIGQTLIILTAGIDLSIGAIMVLSSFVMAHLLFQNHVPAVLCLVVRAHHRRGRAGGERSVGHRVNLPPFIVTLGTLNIFTAIALIYAKGQTITLSTDVFLVWTGKSFSIGSVNITYGVVLMLLLYVIFSYSAALHSVGQALVRDW
jgi:fructose transport system permease protein